MTPRISAVALCCSSASVSSRFLRLEILRQAGVLDGDGGLGGEALQQGDLLARERPRARPPDEDAAQGHAVPRERHDEDCPDPTVVQAKLHEPAEAGCGRRCAGRERGPAAARESRGRPACPTGSACVSPSRCKWATLAMRGHQAVVVALHQVDERVGGLAQSGRGPGDRAEDGLQRPSAGGALTRAHAETVDGGRLPSAVAAAALARRTSSSSTS